MNHHAAFDARRGTAKTTPTAVQASSEASARRNLLKELFSMLGVWVLVTRRVVLACSLEASLHWAGAYRSDGHYPLARMHARLKPPEDSRNR